MTYKSTYSKFGKLSGLVLASGFFISSNMTAHADQVGEIGVDWIGNDIIVEAISDPKVEGVTCHITYFERGLIDRFQKGNWFEDPSNSSISCRQTGSLKVGDIDLDEDGENVFSERRSIILKSLKVKRVFDAKNQTLIYVAHSQQINNGSAKTSISTVPLFPNTLEALQVKN